MPSTVAPRARRVRQALQHQRGRALAHHEAVARLLEGAGRLLRVVVARRQRREQREADQRLRLHRPVGADARAPPRPRRAGSPRRRAGSPRRRSRRPWSARSARRACRSARPAVRRRRRTGSVSYRSAPPGRDVGRSARIGRRCRCASARQLEALRPFDLDRRHAEHQRPGEGARAPSAGLRQRFLDRRRRPCARRARARSRAPRRRPPPAGPPCRRWWCAGGRSGSGGCGGCRTCPAISAAQFARATPRPSGRDDADAGDRDQRAAEMIAVMPRAPAGPGPRRATGRSR